jgi:hypothetical protein
MNKKVVDLTDLYYFWSKYQQSNKYSLYYKEYKGMRTKQQFELMLECKLIMIQTMHKHTGDFNGQTKAEYTKNYTRVRDIFTKCAGDEEKAIRLARTQAIRITDEHKAINRAMVARQLERVENEPIYESVFEVFFQRAYELGTVTKQDYRDYQLEKLGI